MDFSSTIQEIEQVVTNMRNEQELASVLQSLGQRLEHQEEAHSEILKGNLVCCTSSKKYFISIKARPRTLDRAVEAPANETILSGPRNSFTEDLSINLGLMRKELVTKDLIVNSFLIGEEHKRK